jgi:hypothetical protein
VQRSTANLDFSDQDAFPLLITVGGPGAGLSVFLGQAVLARLLQDATPVLRGGGLDPGKPLPHSLDLYGITIDR